MSSSEAEPNARSHQETRHIGCGPELGFSSPECAISSPRRLRRLWRVARTCNRRPPPRHRRSARSSTAVSVRLVDRTEIHRQTQRVHQVPSPDQLATPVAVRSRNALDDATAQLRGGHQGTGFREQAGRRPPLDHSRAAPTQNPHRVREQAHLTQVSRDVEAVACDAAGSMKT